MEEKKNQTAETFDLSQHKYVVPMKKIDDPVTLEHFKKSEACNDLLGFIGMCSQAVQKTRMTQTTLPDVSLVSA